jgi:RNA polymerase sigma factor (sigma-70 family)
MDPSTQDDGLRPGKLTPPTQHAICRQLCCQVIRLSGFCGLRRLNREDMNDRELLRQYAEGHSEDAFGKLVEHHLPMVYSVAMRILRDQQLSEEIAQNAFRKLAETALQLRPNQVIGGWLYNTTRHLALNALRGERRRREREMIAHSMQPLESPHDPIQEDLHLAMAELDEDDRDVLVLRFLESRTLHEVGEELRISEEAARKRVTRALDRLRDRFEHKGTSISAVGLSAALSAALLPVPESLSAGIVASVCAKGAVSAAAGVASISTLQKGLFATALVALVTVALYQAFQSSMLRRKVEALTEQRAQITSQLEKREQELEGVKQGLLAARARNELLQENSSELLRLRNEVAMLRRERLTGGSMVGGKTVTEWLREYDEKTHDLSDEARNAIRKIGTNGVPELLTALLSSEVGYTRETSAMDITPWQVTCAFRALGPLGKQAVPTLIEFLRRSDAEWLQVQAAACLGFIGPEANAAVPALLEMFRHGTSDPFRVNLIGALVRIGGDGSVLLPIYSSSLGDRSSTVRDWAATGLGKFGPEAADAIPKLVAALGRQDEEGRVLYQELKAIEAIGPTTNDIAPSIQKFLTHPHGGVRDAATNVLSRLGDAH